MAITRNEVLNADFMIRYHAQMSNGAGSSRPFSVEMRILHYGRSITAGIIGSQCNES
jgi:hypothetical protein